MMALAETSVDSLESIKASTETPVYKVPFRYSGNLRQVRQSLQIIREQWGDESSNLRLWSQCPGVAAPLLTIEEFSLSFILQRHEKRYRKTLHRRPNPTLKFKGDNRKCL
jgi:hypothetical protein